MQERNEARFKEKAAELAEWVKAKNHFLLVYNHDADGISSGAITATALKRIGKSFSSKPLKQLYKEEIEKLKGKAENFIFVDFGSGQLGELKKAFKTSFAVVDHHQTKEEEFKLHLNPMLFGVDGGSEISAAGTCYVLATAIDEKNSDLAALAIVGAVGDMQESGGALQGFNRKILQEGIEAGVLEKKTDLRLYGRGSRPLVQFLQFSTNPIIPMLTGSEEKCIKFLSANGIELKQGEKWRSYNDLSGEEKKKLASALIVHMHSFNVEEWKIKELIGEVYTLPKEKSETPLSDAKEFATVLNSCGRHSKAETALKVCMGNRKEAYTEALVLLAEHRKQLREGIELMQQKGLEEKEHFYFFDAGNKIKDSIIGIVAGMIYSSQTVAPIKPIIALSRTDDGDIKASGRATSELTRRGLNLGKIFKEMEKEIGKGLEGGGHRIAAGVKFREELREEFLEKLDKKIGEQLAGKIYK